MKLRHTLLAFLLLGVFPAPGFCAPVYPEFGEIPPRLRQLFEERLHVTRIRVDLAPSALLVENTDGIAFEYRYFIRVREGDIGLHGLIVGYCPDDTVGIDFREMHPSDEWRISPASIYLPIIDLSQPLWLRKGIDIYWLGGLGPNPGPGGSAGPFVFQTAALPGIVDELYFGYIPVPGPWPEWVTKDEIDRLDKAMPPYSHLVHDSTVGPGVLPWELTLDSHVLRLESLVEDAARLNWLGEEARESLAARVRSARRKLALGGEGGAHNAAAWTKLISFRDDLRKAHDEWLEEWAEEREDHARGDQVRSRARGRRRDPAPFVPRYDDAPIPEDAADERAWALLEPNVRYLIERLAPPRTGRGRGTERD